MNVLRFSLSFILFNRDSSIVVDMCLYYLSRIPTLDKLSPTDMKTGFMSYKTSVYRLSLYETASSLKFVVNTDNEASQQEVFMDIFQWSSICFFF